MIKLIAVFEVKSEWVDKIEDIVWPLVVGSRSEKGCISYNFVRDAAAENVFMFLEEWQSEEAIAAHNNTAHFAEYVPKMGEYCTKSVLHKIVM